MPVILNEAVLELWLNTKNKYLSIIEDKILHESNNAWEEIKYYRVAPYVSKNKNKDIKCLMTHENYRKHLDSVGIKKFFSVVPKKNVLPKVESTETVATQVQRNNPMKRKN